MQCVVNDCSFLGQQLCATTVNGVPSYGWCNPENGNACQVPNGIGSLCLFNAQCTTFNCVENPGTLKYWCQ